MIRIPPAALIGLFFTSVFFFCAIFAPFIAPLGMAAVVGDVWEPSSSGFLLGTDSIGRDLLSRMIWGGRTTIFIATAATILSFATGSILGFFAAVSGGWIDQALSRFIDLIMSIPSLDRKSTRLNSSHTVISYAVFCFKKKRTRINSMDFRTNRHKIRRII